MAAAGNGGLDLDAPSGPRFYPASSTLVNVLAVTAVDQSGRLASFSNFGTTSVDLAAPGTNILSTYPASVDCPSPCYAWSAGTSMATPHVSGVAALAGSHQPGLLASPILLRGRLLATGRPLATTDGKTSTGRLVNAMRAIDAEQADGPCRRPVRVRGGLGHRVTKHHDLRALAGRDRCDRPGSPAMTCDGRAPMAGPTSRAA